MYYLYLFVILSSRDDLGYKEWQDIVDEEVYLDLDHLLVTVKFNAKSFDNPSRSNIAAIKVSDIRLKIINLFSIPFHLFGA
jgi:hypothetical protein